MIGLPSSGYPILPGIFATILPLSHWTSYGNIHHPLGSARCGSVPVDSFRFVVSLYQVFIDVVSIKILYGVVLPAKVVQHLTPRITFILVLYQPVDVTVPIGLSVNIAHYVIREVKVRVNPWNYNGQFLCCCFQYF
jgi:hypothetical protein